MVTVAHLLGANLDEATKEVNEMIDFETELAKVSVPVHHKHHKKIKSFTVSGVSE